MFAKQAKTFNFYIYQDENLCKMSHLTQKMTLTLGTYIFAERKITTSFEIVQLSIEHSRLNASALTLMI